MKQITKAAIVAMGAALVSQAALASITANDLYLGFNRTGSSDLIIDLGQAGGITGQSTVVDLSSYFTLSQFSSIFTGGASGVYMGVVGGQAQFPSSYNIYATSPIGSDMSGFFHSSGIIQNSINDLSGAALPTGGAGSSSQVTANSSTSWTSLVSPTYFSGTFYGDSGINPSSAIGGSGIITEGLWQATDSSAYTYLGYFTADTTGSGPSLTFTSIQAAPEPSTLALLAGGGILLSILRWRVARKNA